MKAPHEALAEELVQGLRAIGDACDSFAPDFGLREIGRVRSLSAGIARVTGLPSVGYEELLLFPRGVVGIAFNIDAEEIGVVLLGEHWLLQAGEEVERTGRVMDVRVGE